MIVSLYHWFRAVLCFIALATKFLNKVEVFDFADTCFWFFLNSPSNAQILREFYFIAISMVGTALVDIHTYTRHT